MNRAPVIKLATTALHAAMREEWPAANTAVQAINDRHGPEALLVAMLAWADTLIVNQTGEFAADKPVAIAFKAVETGEVNGADDVRAEVAWAGRMLGARAADDPDTWDALLASVPGDPKVIGAHVGALLEIVALGLGEAS